MAKSKLEIYVAIINSLSKQGPLRLEDIPTFVDINLLCLKEHVDLLVERGLIREEYIQNPVFGTVDDIEKDILDMESDNIAPKGYEPDAYSVTEYGARILKFFSEKGLV